MKSTVNLKYILVKPSMLRIHFILICTGKEWSNSSSVSGNYQTIFQFNRFPLFHNPEAEFKEFEPRLKYGGFHLKVYSIKAGAQLKPVLADLSRGSNLLNSDTDHFLKYVCNRCVWNFYLNQWERRGGGQGVNSKFTLKKLYHAYFCIKWILTCWTSA